MCAACAEFGEVIAIHSNIDSDESGRLCYSGTGFAQYRDPRSLRAAWNSQQIRERTRFTSEIW
eukprot:1530994-Karenia_brevis.AAC.1